MAQQQEDHVDTTTTMTQKQEGHVDKTHSPFTEIFHPVTRRPTLDQMNHAKAILNRDPAKIMAWLEEHAPTDNFYKTRYFLAESQIYPEHPYSYTISYDTTTRCYFVDCFQKEGARSSVMQLPIYAGSKNENDRFTLFAHMITRPYTFGRINTELHNGQIVEIFNALWQQVYMKNE
jgi:hypothetical protein